MKAHIKNTTYGLLIMYYLVLNYFVEGVIVKYSLQYFLFVTPVLIFVGTFSAYLISKKHSSKGMICLVFFMIVSAISLLRLDTPTFLSTFLFAGSLIVIFNTRMTVGIRFINLLFLLSILGSVVSYHLGSNAFGYIPQPVEGEDLTTGAVGWRISLFPLVAESGFFALLVILTNYYLNKSRSRFVFIGLAFYFLIFSGSRTSLVIFVFFICFLVVSHFFPFRRRALYEILNPLLIGSFILLLSFKSLLLLIKDTRIGFLNEYIFKSESGMAEDASREDVATRSWLWAEHLRIYGRSPIIGVGTFDFARLKTEGTKSYHASTGSESFITGLLARVGLPALLMVYLIFVIQRDAMNSRNRLVYLISLFIFISMISYGSFLVPYNFMFLLLFGVANNELSTVSE